MSAPPDSNPLVHGRTLPGTFVALSPDGIGRFEFDPAVPVEQPEDAVIDAQHANARPAERNAAFARPHPAGDRGGFGVAGAGTQDAVPLRVLLAEDNAVNQVVVGGLLRAAGHTVRVAANGRAAVDALAAEPFDVVLMDVQMPEMDGFEATAAIRATEAGTGRRLPIIAFTARATAADREECLRRGMDDFVSKPIRPTELYQVLARLRPLPAASPSIATGAGLGDAGTGVSDPGYSTVVLDEAGFRGRCGGRDDLVRRVARLFLSECPRYLDCLRSALAVGDAAALRVAAHTLKGAIGNLSAGAAFASAERLEDLARDGDLTAAAVGLVALEADLGRLRPALRSLLAVERPARGHLVART